MKSLSIILSKVTNADARPYHRYLICTLRVWGLCCVHTSQYAIHKTKKISAQESFVKTSSRCGSECQSTAWLHLLSSVFFVTNVRKFKSFPQNVAGLYAEILLYIWILWFFGIAKCCTTPCNQNLFCSIAWLCNCTEPINYFHAWWQTSD